MYSKGKYTNIVIIISAAACAVMGLLLICRAMVPI